MVRELRIIIEQIATTGMNQCLLSVRVTTSMYQYLILIVVVVEDQCQVCHINNNFYLFFRQSTVLIIGFNTLESIIRTESRFIK